MSRRQRYRCQEGATATEYVFLVAFIALILVAGAAVFGQALGGRMDSTATQVEQELNSN